MTQPTNVADWNTSGTNRTDPGATQKSTGWTVSQNPPSSYFNWWMNVVGLWVQYVKNIAAEAITWTGTQVFTPSTPSTVGLTATGNQAGGIVATGGTTTAGGIGVSGTGGLGSAGAGGDGVTGLGRNTGAGVSGKGGVSNGSGVSGTGTSNGAGVVATGGSGGRGLVAVGNGGSSGVDSYSFSGPGGLFVSGAAAAPDISLAGTINPASTQGFSNALKAANVPKAWAQVADSAGTVAVNGGFNIASVTIVGASAPKFLHVTFATAMLDANYAVVLTTMQKATQTLSLVLLNACNVTAAGFDIAAVTCNTGTQVDLGSATIQFSLLVHGLQ